MNKTRIKVDPDNPATFPRGRIDFTMADATGEDMIALHQREDEAIKDAARHA